MGSVLAAQRGFLIMIRKFGYFSLIFGVLTGSGLSALPRLAAGPQEKKKDAQQAEEADDYYRKWLEEIAVYIISDEEKAVFQRLTTPEEKENFIEQFWYRRDPEPRTSDNEFKTEHYRRIAYANERFTSGDPGWQTDRGRVYILHGQPDSIESRPTGGAYMRPIEEGGGTTGVFPYEKWRYRYIEGLGDDIEVEFVDPTFTGEFRLSVFPWEKDAYLHSPGGATLAEQTGIATKADREAFTPAAGGGGNNPQTLFRRLEDTPFARYELAARIQGRQPLKFKDLKEQVDVNISYSQLPFEARSEYFRLNDQQVLAPVTIRVRNQDLTFNQEGDRYVARMAVYGLVSSMSNRFLMEFDEEIRTSFRKEELEKGLTKSSVYQKVIPVDGRTRYKLDLVLKDLNSNTIGTQSRALIPPKYPDQLAASSLILSDQIQPLKAVPEDEQMFVLGDVLVLPNLDRRFAPGMPLGVYFHIYNFSIEQSSLTPLLSVTYKLFKGDELIRMAVEPAGESIQFYSGQRAVFVKLLSLDGLEPGAYRVQIEVADGISNQEVQLAERFQLVEWADLN